MLTDKIYLMRAFKLAQYGEFTTTPNPNVGCVIVHNGCIVGEGYHMKAGEPHAEACALYMAGAKAKGATAYVTLEPCSHYGNTAPCANMLVAAGIKRVVIAMLDPNPKVSGCGVNILQQAGLKVSYNIMFSEAEKLNPGFLKLMRTGLPYIKLKLAASLDGRTAMSSGESRWITSIQSRQDVQKLRAKSDAILSTANTVLTDNSILNVRWTSLPENIKKIYPKINLRQPIRIIIDSNNQIMPSTKLIKYGGEIWLIRLHPDKQIWPKSVKQLIVQSIFTNKKINLVQLMIKLGYNKINSILVEAGANLSGSLLNYGLVDELIIYQATKLLGANAKPLFFLKKLNNLNEALTFSLIDLKKIGPDIRLILKPNESINKNI